MRYYLKKSFDLKKIMFLSLLTVLALSLSLTETWLRIPVGVPGIKLGLANVITIVTLIFFRYSDALIMTFIRCITASLFIGGPVIFLFSISGGIISLTVMWLMLKYMQKAFSLAGISIAGAVVHNTAQIFIACFLMSDTSIVAYLPILLLSAIITGAIVGVLSNFLVKAMKKLNLIENI